MQLKNCINHRVRHQVQQWVLHSRVVVKIVGLLRHVPQSLLNGVQQPSDKPIKKAAKGGEISTIEFGGVFFLWSLCCGISASGSRCHAGALKEARWKLETKKT